MLIFHYHYMCSSVVLREEYILHGFLSKGENDVTISKCDGNDLVSLLSWHYQ